MAKRPDFAQKLLDDLRLRKERMATAQSSGNSNRTHKVGRSDSCGNFRQHSRASTRVNSSNVVATSRGDAHRFSGTGRDKSLAIYEASREIVPMKGARSSEHMADLSMVLAFALENGGKLRKLESSGNGMVGFLHHMGTKSLDLGKMDRRGTSGPSDNRYPTFSYIHVKEISKGAQKLNHILKACSNGHNFNRYSIDIGKELLKGATDLEESLRMLVSLQEASDDMLGSQRRHKIKLLEDEDDDTTTINESDKKQLDRPRFSFDGPSRSSHKSIREVAKTTFFKHTLLALPYLAEAPNTKPGQHAQNTSPKMVSHKHSVSCGPESTISVEFSDTGIPLRSSHSKPERARIPNVIAKLMGIEELPLNIDSNCKAVQKNSTFKQNEGKELKYTALGSTKKVEFMIKDSENHTRQTVKQKMLQENEMSQSKITTPVPHETHAMVIGDGKPHWKGPEKENMNISYSRPTLRSSMQQINLTESNHVTRIRKGNREKERSTEKDDSTKWITKDYLQMMAPKIYKQSEATYMKLEEAQREENKLQKEKKNTGSNLFMLRNQQKPSKDNRFQQAYRSKSHEEKLQLVEREHQTARIQLQKRKPKGSNTLRKNSEKPSHNAENLLKGLPYMNHATANKRNSTVSSDVMPSKGPPGSSHHEDLIREDGSCNLKPKISSRNRSLEERSASLNYPATETEEAIGCIPRVVAMEPACVAPLKKEANTQGMHISKILRKVDEGVVRTESPWYKSRSLKQKIPALQEPKQRNQKKISESEGAEGTQSLKLEQCLQKEDYQTPTLGTPVEDECQRPEEPDATTPNATIQDMHSKVDDSQQDPSLRLDKDQALKSCNFNSIQLEGPHETHAPGIPKSSQKEHQKISKSGTHESLMENENQLKQILIKSQLFLNAAEALFKLRIPFDILHASAHKCDDEENKLVLDCSYEVMRRKGRRQELNSHPCMKFPMGSKKLRSLDDLVKELHGDLENLKLYGKNGSNEYDASDFLHKILERDIQYRDPDLNCMWDFSWSKMMFLYLEKDDVIRDLEKTLLNGIIDEITRDMVHPR